MLSLEQAQEAIIGAIRSATRSETVSLADAAGRYLAEAATAVVGNPAFDNSSMDGYAVNTADLVANGFVLPLLGESACGSAPATMAPATTMRIFTGAPVPAGADAVVIQEDIKIDGDKIVFPHSVQPGQNIRFAGEDFKAGDSFFNSGHRLTAADLALLSSAGVAQLKVWQRPRALVIATGDELKSPGEPLQPGQIYESNRLATIILLRDIGCDVTDGGNVRDDLDAVREILARAGDYDFIVTSGGVSVGDHDLVKKAFEEIGEIDFWKVKIKPGKPVAFGRLGERGHFLGLPGNPVSSLVTFKLFLEPAVAAWYHAGYRLPEFDAELENSYSRHAGRTEFLRAYLEVDSNGEIHAHILKGQGSHMLGTLSEANGLVRIEHDVSELHAGDRVSVILLREHLPAGE